MKQDITETITIPQGITATASDSTITIKGPKGELTRAFIIPGITLTIKENTISLKTKQASRHEKTAINTTKAHINNMIRGTQEPFKYILKICSGHFPMTVTITKEECSVKNFLGEKVPRKTRIPAGAEAKVEGDKITIMSTNRELAGQAASNIEQLMQVRGRDRRVFQDGIYIIEKPKATQ